LFSSYCDISITAGHPTIWKKISVGRPSFHGSANLVLGWELLCAVNSSAWQDFLEYSLNAKVQGQATFNRRIFFSIKVRLLGYKLRRKLQTVISGNFLQNSI